MFGKKVLIVAMVALTIVCAEDAGAEDTAEAIVEGDVAVEADAAAVDCTTDEAATCVEDWVANGCIPEAPEGCGDYEGCAMEQLAAGACGVDCMDETAQGCEMQWIDTGCSMTDLSEDFVAECDAYKACGMLTMTQGRCPEDAAMEEACAEQEKACMDNEACKTQFDEAMNACLGGSEDSAQFSSCMTDAMNPENFAEELQETVDAWATCVSEMEAEMEAMCGEQAAVDCVGVWVDVGCPIDFEPTDDCMQYEACALGAMDEGLCPEEDAEEPAVEEVVEEAAEEEEAAAQDEEAAEEQAAEGEEGEAAEGSAGMAATTFAAIIAFVL